MQRCGGEIASRTDVQRGTDRVARRRLASGRGGFTLIELVVVIAIMILLIAIAAPAVGPAMTSNYRMQAINAMNSSLTMAQTYALSNTTDVAIRVERATELNGYGRLTNRTNPKWLDHQQIRFVMLNKSAAVKRPVFEYIKDSKITALPSAIWFAPANYMGDPLKTGDEFGPYDPFTPKKPDTLDDPDNYGAIGYWPFDTFYVAFSSNGMLKIWSAATNPAWYVDDTQKFKDYASPMIAHPHDSASGLLMYERKKLDVAPKDYKALWDFLRVNGQALYINRFLGTAVESQ